MITKKEQNAVQDICGLMQLKSAGMVDDNTYSGMADFIYSSYGLYSREQRRYIHNKALESLGLLVKKGGDNGE